MSGSMQVNFWGVRGSYPSPGPQTAVVGGNTACVQIRAADHTIILDAGTGIIGLGRALMAQHRDDDKPITATILFSHTHHDHTQGFPFFNPLYLPSTTLYVFGPKTLQDDLELVLSRAMLPPVFPVTFDHLPCVRVVRNLNEGEAVILNNGGLEPRVLIEQRNPLPTSVEHTLVHVLRSSAHPQGVLVYRVEHRGRSVVYATDTEGYASGDQRLIQFARGATLLIHDAQYTEREYANPATPKQGWGHSTWRMAAEVAQAAGVGRLVLFHHEPEHGDEMLISIEREAQAVFKSTVLAREGMQIEL